MNLKRILVVDDEETLCEALKFNLESEGFVVDTANGAEEALANDTSVYDLFLLDIMMGEISGIQLAKILKANPATAKIPIIFCTAMDGEENMIKGLELGADDYIAKPYSIRNVVARIKTVLRRMDPEPVAPPEPERITFRGLVIVPSAKICFVDGNEVKLPKKEFEILHKLITNRGRIFTREELLRDIWPGDVVVLDRVVDVNIARIRQKLGLYGRHIKTRSGYGYGFIE